MSEYLVRWKFGPNSLLNNLDVETNWYQAFYPNKEKAVDQYISWMHNNSPHMAMTVEIFELVKLVPGQPEPEEESEPDQNTYETYRARNAQIMELFRQGHSRREIADRFGLSYQAVYGVTRKYS